MDRSNIARLSQLVNKCQIEMPVGWITLKGIVEKCIVTDGKEGCQYIFA